MSSTLSEGVRVPDIGSTSWGADVNYNWGLLNTALANITGNVKTDVANTWTATQTFTETISGSIDGIAARAVGDEDGNNIKTALAGKQSSLSQAQLDAVNSGITSAAVQQIGTNASGITALQTAVATKAADNEVVHLAGSETITGAKTFTASNIKVANSTNTALLYCIAFEGWTFGATPASSLTGSFRTIDSAGAIVSDIMTQILASGVNQTVLRTRNTDGTNTHDRRMRLTVAQNGDTALEMSANAVADLGTSSNKWKSLNGINPGVLSFPADSFVNLDTTSWDLTGVTFTYTPTSDGWLMINVRPSNNVSRVAVEYMSMRVASESSSGKNAMVTCPVKANSQYSVNIIAASIAQARLIPCLGNV